MMSQERRITIRDIAAKANVSISTVSRVLNGNAPVTPNKQEAVLKAMQELDYRPNVFAQGLASGQSMTIGALTQNIGGPLHDSMLRGILVGLEDSNYTPLFADGYWDAKREEEAINILLDRRVDGLIVVGGDCAESVLCEVARQIPLILVGRNIAGIADQCLSLEDYHGGYTATQHLIEMGHRNIAHVTGMLSHQDAVERREGYKQALLDNGLEVNPELIIEGNYNEQAGVLAIEMLLTGRKNFTALFAANDQMAYGARLALYRRGIRVPQDISIVGYDDQPTTAYMTPPLTSIRIPAVEIGEGAARALLRLMRGEAAAIPRFPPTLSVRESVARYR